MGLHGPVVESAVLGPAVLGPAVLVLGPAVLGPRPVLLESLKDLDSVGFFLISQVVLKPVFL